MSDGSRRIGLVLAVAVVGVFFGLVTFASFRLPAPTGALPVGTLDTILPDGVAVALWYPAAATAGRAQAPYRPDLVHRTLRQRVVLPFVRTWAFVDAPIAAGPHPLVLYMAGWGEQRYDSTALCEDLASHGMVVAAIGDLRPEPGMDFASDVAYRRTVRWADEKVQLQARGLSDLLTSLRRLGPSHPAYQIASKLDYNRIAAIGYSFGGATAAQAVNHDDRIRSAIDLDGWIFGDAARNGVRKPFMIVGTGAATLNSSAVGDAGGIALGRYEAELDTMNARQIGDGFRRHGGYNVRIDGTQHDNFCDAGLLRLRSVPGAIDSRRAQRIIVAYVNAFLGLTLRGESTALLPGAGLGTTVRSDFDRAASITSWSPASAIQRVRG